MEHAQQVAESAAGGVELAHGWRLIAIPPIEAQHAERALREPAAAVPSRLAARLGPLRIFAVAYLTCTLEGDMVSDAPGGEESHSSLWLEQPDRIDLFLSCSDTDEHDLGFELLAAAGQLAATRATDEEFSAYAGLVRRELLENEAGEIDEDALEAKTNAAVDYLAVSLGSTLAEFMHALWHDVEVREGPEHLSGTHLRTRFDLLARFFPPNPGYQLFR